MIPEPPRATLRLQLHKDYTFAHAQAQVPYFAELGVSHLYCSPMLTARAGSTHGYDQVDPGAVNPELGGEDGLRALAAALRERGMGLIADIVPNHMAVGRHDNPWWQDVLEWGRESPYANWFDIDWDVPDPALNGRLLAPFLGKSYGEVLEAGELALRCDAASGQLYVEYFEHHFPLAPSHYAWLLRSSGDPVLAELAQGLRQSAKRARRDAFSEARRALAAHPAMPSLLARYSTADDEGRARMHGLLERQHYRLAWWRSAADEINWRRFFDVIDLAGLRAQEPAVFEATHATILRLYAQGLIDGVRVDHVDGLADPRAYCRKLRARLQTLASQRPHGLPRAHAWMVVEKILAPEEQLPRDWRTDGTSGYAYMNEAGALLHDAAGEAPLRALWSELTGNGELFEEEVRQARRRIPQTLLSADFNACAHALHAIARSEPLTRDWSLQAVKRVLAELLVHFPVYRTYADARGRSEADAQIMARVVASAKGASRAGEQALVDLVDRWLGGEAPADVTGSTARRARLRAIARFQQLTSPVAAKSVEDTAFYRHGTLLSRNEVGADPAQFSLDAAGFHRACKSRLRRHPHAMLATATHDHKRGEDVRARLAVLSEAPQRWADAVRGWMAASGPLRAGNAGLIAPDATDEYLLYQMITGAWPLDLEPEDIAGVADFSQRIAQWQQKAVREAKRRSGWVEPNLAYEEGCAQFLRALFDSRQSGTRLQDIADFVSGIAAAGAVNGLTQTLLKLTTPGVPDTYQGCEFWDYSLVDPDNRRPVDFTARAAALARASPLADLATHWRDGHIKQALVARVLALRAREPALFAAGDYLPLKVSGARAAHVVAFLRRHEGTAALAAAVRLPCALGVNADDLRIASGSWGDTQIVLPPELARAKWRDALGDADFSLAAQNLFKELPVALHLCHSGRSEESHQAG